ncbi:hypothetical protein LTR56_027416 [Elasticomyces elasticus]|nr:hypothetical protein LTR56_027416 [Elasticomyces elasticus]KAK4896503.1 hypothetical protein LTR49_028132 [Elasticomyces elasticus]KAK5733136.1 hypothetical protein LTS12_026996 [Elasticomyces elasticus]
MRGGRDVVTWLSGHAPKAEDWSSRQKNVGLLDRERYEEQIRSLVDRDTGHMYVTDRCQVESIQSLLQLVRQYATNTEKRWEGLKQEEAWTHFQQLMLFSICLVLEVYGNSASEVDDLIWWTSPNKNKRKAILRGTKWVHEAIMELVKRGWTPSRATELFLIVPLSFTRLTQLSSKKSGCLADRLENPDAPSNNQKPQITPCFTFPTLIEQICKAHRIELSLEQICQALSCEVPEENSLGVYEVRTSGIGQPSQPTLQIQLVHPDQSARKSDARPDNDPVRPRKKVKHCKDPSAPTVQSRPSCHSISSQAINEDEQALSEITFGTLVHLIRNLGFDPSEDLLFRGVRRQNRWDNDGHITTVCLRDTGLSEQYAFLFRDKNTLSVSMQLCVQRGMLKRQLKDQSWVYHVTSDEQNDSEHDNNPLDSLIFLCYICPREEALDPKFFTVIRQLLPALLSWFDYLQQQAVRTVDVNTRKALIETCVATSKVTVSHSSQKALVLAHKLCNQDVSPSFLLAIAKMQSVALRRQDRYAESDQAIKEAMCGVVPKDVRTTCLIGQLYLSLAENEILRNQYDSAIRWIEKIDLTSPSRAQYQVSPLVWQLYEHKWIATGRIYRFQGRFEDAIKVLEPCLGVRRHLPASNTHHVVRQLADVYVELGQPAHAKSLLDKSLGQILQEGKQHSRSYNKLLLSYADAEIASDLPDDAQLLLDKIGQSFEHTKPSTPTDQLDHVRTVIGMTRIAMHKSDWIQVTKLSTEALRLTDIYSSFTPNNYYKGYIRKVQAASHLHLACADMEAAEQCVREPRHFMAGIGTYDLEKANLCLRAGLQSCASMDKVPLSPTGSEDRL